MFSRAVRWMVAIGCLLLPLKPAWSAETVTVALPSKAFQFVIFPIAQERGFMKEEGIDLRIVFVNSAIGIQTVLANEAQFTGSGSSALVAVAKGNAPLKTVLAVNDQVLQWLMVRPQYNRIDELKNKKIVVTGVASIATFMLKKVAPKYGLDANKEVTFLAAGANNRVAALLSGAVDAGLLGTEERYAARDQGMKELLYLGREVKNSWGTVATSDQFLKEKPKVMMGTMRALLKAMRIVKKDKAAAVSAVVKFSGLKKELADRMYDDLIGTFTNNGAVDEETQKNDLDIVRLVANVDKEVPVERAYDFSFALKADRELNAAGWNP